MKDLAKTILNQQGKRRRKSTATLKRNLKKTLRRTSRTHLMSTLSGSFDTQNFIFQSFYLEIDNLSSRKVGFANEYKRHRPAPRLWAVFSRGAPRVAYLVKICYFSPRI